MSQKHSLVRSFQIAFRGLFHGLMKERNSRIQIIVAAIVLSLSLYLKITKLEFILIAALCFFVIILELINTSIERLLNVLYPNHHPEIGLVKDIMSGVVLLGSLFAVVVGTVILKTPFLNMLNDIILQLKLL